MSGERYTVDANILVYAIDLDSGYKHYLAKRLWAAMQRRNCLLTTQTLAETYNAISKKRPAHTEEACRLLSMLAISVPVVSADSSDFELAMVAHRSRPIHFWDAMLWATARRYGCRTILTEDQQDKPVVDDVRYTNPFAVPEADLARFLLP
jgi:predicted nucleic acid-binding protein